ncbi:tartronate semialdehyde reductase [Planotetraspora thailandica]|uniref:Tartronate semialdehyde reductase n=1 Tax=Planotetraspora thailandica TaxID=487172 RepID=A0A8J3VFY9_9ACTN|nr:NAD(P)-dependent oxidoreductase [Planotetraspora thailandica]GII57900.1 tartronate semialdehyde reductase [Planotetraspora thailandica]
MRIAVLGMGRMGRALAERLLRQHFSVTVWNRSPGKAADVLDEGATLAPSPAEAVRNAQAVVLSLADDHAVHAVMEQVAEAASGRDDLVVADTSTVSPATSRSLRDLAPGGRFVAAPILGGPLDVVLGNARTLLGGDRVAVERITPIWRDAFASFTYCGDDPGCAVTLKLLSNYLLMSNIVLVSEIVATAEAAGIDRKAFRELLFKWPSVPPLLHNRLDDIIGGDHAGWFTTLLGAKDVRLTREIAESHGLVLPLAHLVERLYEEAADEGWADSDVAAVVELVRRGTR